MSNLVYLLFDHTIRELENERASTLERQRILEERHQRELENEKAAAAKSTRLFEEIVRREMENEREAILVRMRSLEESFQRESQLAMSWRSRSESLETECARLNEFVLSKKKIS